MKKGLSIGLPEISIFSSMAFKSASILFSPSSGLVSWRALMAEPLMNCDLAGS